MPIFLMKLITNKYVIVGLLALALFGYVKCLNTSLSEARKEAQGYAAIAKDVTRGLEALKQSYAKERDALKALADGKQKVSVKVQERVQLVTKLEKVYVEKDSVCSLSDESYILLTDAYKDADNSSKPTQ